MSRARIPFPKKWESCENQVQILSDRGLIIRDRAAAVEFLEHINYYRFSGFCLAFEQSRHRFVPGTTFEQVRAAYDFDLRLRDLLNEALEVVEIDLRTAIAAPFGRDYGPFGHTRSGNFFHIFSPRTSHANWLNKLRKDARKSSELFVTHFRDTYAEFPDLPVWVVTETMSFGSLSLMLGGMYRADKAKVARRYAVQPVFLESWVHHLVYVRNICAHHARLWDRRWDIKPQLVPSRQWSAMSPDNATVFVTLLILHQLMKPCRCLDPFRTRWREQVQQHVGSLPDFNGALGRLGMRPGWMNHPVWMQP